VKDEDYNHVKGGILKLSTQLTTQGKALEMLFSEETLVSACEKYKASQTALIEHFRGEMERYEYDNTLDVRRPIATSPNKPFSYLEGLKSGFLKRETAVLSVAFKVSSLVNERTYRHVYDARRGATLGRTLTTYCYLGKNTLDKALLMERTYALSRLTEDLDTRKFIEKTLLSIWEDKQFQRITSEERQGIRGNFIELAYSIDLKKRQINFCNFETEAEALARWSKMDLESLPTDFSQSLKIHPFWAVAEKTVQMTTLNPVMAARNHIVHSLMPDQCKNPVHAQAAFQIKGESGETNKTLTEELSAKKFNELFSFSIILTAEEQTANGLTGRTFVALSDAFNQEGLKSLQRQEFDVSSEKKEEGALPSNPNMEMVEFGNRFYKKVKTSSDGACALHALLGVKVDGEYKKRNPRQALVAKLTTENRDNIEERVKKFTGRTITLEQRVARKTELKRVRDLLQKEVDNILSLPSQQTGHMGPTPRGTSFIRIGDTQPTEELAALTREIVQDANIVEDTLDHIKGKLTGPGRDHPFNDFYIEDGILTLKKEIEKSLQGVHHYLYNELHTRGFSLNIPRDLSTKILWDKDEPYRWHPKTFKVKLGEMVSRLAAIKWMDESADFLNAYARFKSGTRVAQRFIPDEFRVLLPKKERGLLEAILKDHLERALKGSDESSKMLFFGIEKEIEMLKHFDIEKAKVWTAGLKENRALKEKVFELSRKKEMRSLASREDLIWCFSFSENEGFKKGVLELAPQVEIFKGLNEEAIIDKIKVDSDCVLEVVKLDRPRFITLLEENDQKSIAQLDSLRATGFDDSLISEKIEENYEYILSVISLARPEATALLSAQSQGKLHDIERGKEETRIQIQTSPHRQIFKRWKTLKASEDALIREEKDAWIRQWKDYLKKEEAGEFDIDLFGNGEFLERVFELAPQTQLGADREVVRERLAKEPDLISEVVNLDRDGLVSLLSRSAQQEISDIRGRLVENLESQDMYVNNPEVFTHYVETIEDPDFWFNTLEIELAAYLFDKKVQVINGELQMPASPKPFNNDLPGETIVIQHKGKHFSRCEPLDVTTDRYIDDKLLSIPSSDKHDEALTKLFTHYREFLSKKTRGVYERDTDSPNRFIKDESFQNCTLLASKDPDQCVLAFPNSLLKYIEENIAPRGIRRAGLKISRCYSFVVNEITDCYELAIDYRSNGKEYMKFVVAQFGKEVVDSFRDRERSIEETTKEPLFESMFLIQAMYAEGLHIPGEGSFRIISTGLNTVVPIPCDQPFASVYSKLAVEREDKKTLERVDYALTGIGSALVKYGQNPTMIRQNQQEGFFLANKEYLTLLKAARAKAKETDLYKKAKEDFLVLKSLLNITIDPETLARVRLLDPDAIANAESDISWKYWDLDVMLESLQRAHPFKSEERLRLEELLNNLELIDKIASKERFEDSGNVLGKIFEGRAAFSKYDPYVKKQPSKPNPTQQGSSTQKTPPKPPVPDPSPSSSSSNTNPFQTPLSAPRIYNTVGDGDCLIHALLATETDDYGYLYSPQASKYRISLSEQIFKLESRISSGPQRTTCIELRSFERGNVVLQEPRNIVQLSESLQNTTGEDRWLGLEHAELIAMVNELNILVYNERSKAWVQLFYNPESSESTHIISYNGHNHWSKCSLNTTVR